MIALVLGVAAVIGAGWFVSTRHTWKIVRNTAPVPWSRVMPDPAARIAADGMHVVVMFEPASGVSAGSTSARQGVVLVGEKQTGPASVRGVVVGATPGQTLAPWAPSIGTRVEFGADDVLGLF